MVERLPIGSISIPVEASPPIGVSGAEVLTFLVKYPIEQTKADLEILRRPMKPKGRRKLIQETAKQHKLSITWQVCRQQSTRYVGYD